jgi:hypothetical protein
MSNNVYVSHLSQRARVLVASSCAKEIMAVYDGKKCSRIGMNSLFSVKDAYRKLETVYS